MSLASMTLPGSLRTIGDLEKGVVLRAFRKYNRPSLLRHQCAAVRRYRRLALHVHVSCENVLRFVSFADKVTRGYARSTFLKEATLFVFVVFDFQASPGS
jgi:hypothetical protein